MAVLEIKEEDFFANRLTIIGSPRHHDFKVMLNDVDITINVVEMDIGLSHTGNHVTIKYNGIVVFGEPGDMQPLERVLE